MVEHNQPSVILFYLFECAIGCKSQDLIILEIICLLHIESVGSTLIQDEVGDEMNTEPIKHQKSQN
jgi:hypothetical protein